MNRIFKTYQILFTVLVISIGFTATVSAENNDIFLVFYATIDGKSGHVGIAIENYRIMVKDSFDEQGHRVSTYDTVPSGTLTYYDLWPETDDFNAINISDDIPPRYYKLPRASWEDDITVSTLIGKGIPHEEHYPIDGLLRISTKSEKDYQLKEYMDEIIDDNRPFNARAFNCADFVELAIEFTIEEQIEAKELIVLKKSTTPNKLYREVLKIPNVTIIKDGSMKAQGSFTNERLLKKRI